MMKVKDLGLYGSPRNVYGYSDKQRHVEVVITTGTSSY